MENINILMIYEKKLYERMGKVFELMLSYLLWGQVGRQVIKMLVKVEDKRGMFVYKMIEHNMLT